MEFENKETKTCFLICLEQVKARTGLSRSTLYAYIHDLLVSTPSYHFRPLRRLGRKRN